MSQKTYYERKQKGICTKCGKNKAIEGKTMCQQCLDEQNEYRRKNREFFRKNNLCPACGKNKLFGDEKMCPECLAYMAEVNKKSREKHGGNSAYYKRDIARLKENGICRGCRKRKVVTGKTYCAICLEKKRIRSKEYRRRKTGEGLRRSERPAYKLCYTCGSKLDREGRVCQKCADMMTSNLPKIHDNKAWRDDNKFLFKH